MNEQEAQAFLATLEEPPMELDPNSSSSTDLIYTSEEDKLQKQNDKIIDEANDLMLERLKHRDSSLRIQDINSMKAEAFKQNQQLQGNSDDYDKSKIIPTQINIQIVNN